MYERYGGQVEFLAVYVREAHPTGGWRMSANDHAQVAFEQPKTREERESVAAACCGRLEVPMPLLVDRMDDPVGKAYSGMPDRLYLIDRDGRVAYKGGRGPFGYKPGEMQQAIIMLLLDDPGIRREDPGQASIPLAGDAFICHFASLTPGFRRRRGCALRSPEAWARQLRLESYRASLFGCGVNLSPLGAESVSWSVRVATP